MLQKNFCRGYIRGSSFGYKSPRERGQEKEKAIRKKVTIDNVSTSWQFLNNARCFSIPINKSSATGVRSYKDVLHTFAYFIRYFRICLQFPINYNISVPVHSIPISHLPFLLGVREWGITPCLAWSIELWSRLTDRNWLYACAFLYRSGFVSISPKSAEFVIGMFLGSPVSDRDLEGP